MDLNHEHEEIEHQEIVAFPVEDPLEGAGGGAPADNPIVAGGDNFDAAEVHNDGNDHNYGIASQVPDQSAPGAQAAQGALHAAIGGLPHFMQQAILQAAD